MLAVGTIDSVVDLIVRTRRDIRRGWTVTGTCTPPGAARSGADGILGVPVVGDLDTVADMTREGCHRIVAVCPTPGWTPSRLHQMAWSLEEAPTELVVDPGLMEVAGPQLPVDPVDGQPLLRLTSPTFTWMPWVLKHMIDRCGSALLQLLIAPRRGRQQPRRLPIGDTSMTAISFDRSNELQARLHHLVPGGAHTFAKGSDQYPEGMAPVLVSGSGARVRDVDGNEFVEYGMGMRAVTLGHGYAPVVEAVREVLAGGVSFTRPTELELAAAEDFLALVPGADMVKFCKNASDATSTAIRLARAATGRELVAQCHDQPFFSSQDWFVGTLPINTGVPEAVRRLVHSFSYNDLASLERVFADNDGAVACVMLEAASALAEPEPGFLEGVRALCDKHGAVLVFDETITGFRWAAGGAQSVYGVTPDLSTWGKAMGNGFPIAALAGRRELMELGGLNTDRPRVFLLSSTHGAETASLAAFRAVVRAYAESDPVHTMERQGGLLANGVNAVAVEAGIGRHLSVIGRPSCLVFRTADADGVPSQAMRTLYLAEILQRGVLGQSYVISAAHTDADVDQTVEAARGATAAYRQALETRRPEDLFSGRVVAPAHRLHAAPRRLVGSAESAVRPIRSMWSE